MFDHLKKPLIHLFFLLRKKAKASGNSYDCYRFKCPINGNEITIVYYCSSKSYGAGFRLELDGCETLSMLYTHEFRSITSWVELLLSSTAPQYEGYLKFFDINVNAMIRELELEFVKKGGK